jgi:1,4-alpha-glucan branching enzyme
MRQGYGALNARRAVELARLETHRLDALTGAGAPPRIEAGKLIFYYHNDEALCASVAGDFNDWDGRQTLFSREADGLWRAELPAPPAGRYRYKFIIDDVRWLDDPHNGFKESDGFGGFNSILNIA